MTIEEIDGELWIDSGYGLKQVADLVGNIAYLYDGGVVQLTEEEMQELESEHFDPFPLPSEDEMEIHYEEDQQTGGIHDYPYSGEAVAPLLIYKDFMEI